MCSIDSLISKQRDEYTRSVKLNNGRRILHGIVAKADCLSLNKRIYPKAILKREVSSFQKHIRRGTSVGELDHPDYLSPYYQHLTLSSISHRVLKLQWKGSNLLGTIELLPTACGTLLWELYSHGFAIGASLRGWSSLALDASKNHSIVQNDFKLVTFDLVPVPAFPEGYLMPYQKKFCGKLIDSAPLVELAAVGYGAILPQYLTRILDLTQLTCLLRERHIQSNIAMKTSQVNISETWCEDGCKVTPGSYVTKSDATGKYLKAHVPGTRDLANHAVKFARRTLKNNGVAVTTKKTLKDLCTRWMYQGMCANVNVEYKEEKPCSCGWGFISKVGGSLRAVGKFLQFW